LFRGEQSGSEQSYLAAFEISHEGNGDDEKGKVVVKVNDGNDGNSPTERMRIASDGNIGFSETDVEAWGTAGSQHAFQLGDCGIMWSTLSPSLYLVSNMYFDGTNYKYRTANPVSVFSTNQNTLEYRIGGSGTIDTNVSLATRFSFDGLAWLIAGNSGGQHICKIQNEEGGGTARVCYFTIPNQAPNNTSSWFIVCNDSSTNRAICYSNGSWYNSTGTYGTISDVRFKKTVEDARDYTDDFLKLRVVKYTTNDDEQCLGYVAQEVAEIWPKLAPEASWETENPDVQHRVVKTSVIGPPIMAQVLQKLILENREQESLIQSLTARVEVLEAQ
jgi:hypothetical protein